MTLEKLFHEAEDPAAGVAANHDVPGGMELVEGGNWTQILLIQEAFHTSQAVVEYLNLKTPYVTHVY